MSKHSLSPRRKHQLTGFTLPELMITVAILGILSTVAIPNYTNQLCRSESAEAVSSVGSLQAIIAAYIDETGAYPRSWDQLTSISAIMSTQGQASGNFSEKLILPNEKYEVTVAGPTESIYKITAEPIDGCKKRSIKACLNTSTGASELNKGDGTTDAEDAVCT